MRIGVSACLLGEAVRHDGGHKRDRFLTDTLSRFVTFVPVCPEVEFGLGTPREPIRLVRNARGIRLVATKSRRDLTDAMTNWARTRADELRALDLSGYVFKKNSPSCGLFRVQVHGAGGLPSRDGRGLFAGTMTDSFPLLPIEEEGRLSDPGLREAFIERVFAYRRLKAAFEVSWTLGDLMRFHATEKMLLMAHDPGAQRFLGRLLAEGKAVERTELARAYQNGFMAALAKPATTRRHTNVLQHMVGRFRGSLDAAARAELQAVIADFRAGLVPLVVPLTLIRHYVRLLEAEELAGQTYLSPHPKELMLCNHV